MAYVAAAKTGAIQPRYNNLASAAQLDLEAAYAYGELIGRELRAQGYNMSLGGGVDTSREPRNGHNLNTSEKIPSGRKASRAAYSRRAVAARPWRYENATR